MSVGRVFGRVEVDRAGHYAGRRANDNHTPPPIKATPDSRPNSFARHECMNHARPSPAATAQPESVNAASTTEMAHITASCGSTGKAASTNCGRKAVKNAIVFGFRQRNRKAAPDMHVPARQACGA